MISSDFNRHFFEMRIMFDLQWEVYSLTWPFA